jgi:hypothetical protein
VTVRPVQIPDEAVALPRLPSTSVTQFAAISRTPTLAQQLKVLRHKRKEREESVDNTGEDIERLTQEERMAMVDLDPFSKVNRARARAN